MINVCYISEFDFNLEDNASTSRILNNINSIRIGNQFNVKMIGVSNEKQFTKNEIHIVNDISRKGLLGKFDYILRGFRFVKLLYRLDIHFDVIIFYGTQARIIFPLMLFRHLKGSKIVIDFVEWYDYNDLPFGRYGFFAIDVHLGIRKLIPKCDGAIAISKYLESYCSKHGIKTIRIPVTVDTKTVHFDLNYETRKTQEGIRLIYAGVPGNKDLIDIVILATLELVRIGYNVTLYIVGSVNMELNDRVKFLGSNYIFFTGYLSKVKLIEYYKMADYSVFIRPMKRSTMAGFPTKFVESLNFGIPVITNTTSDIGDYLVDRYNGYIIEDITVQSVIDTIIKVFNNHVKEGLILRKNSRNTAISNFDFRNYSFALKKFLTNIINKN